MERGVRIVAPCYSLLVSPFAWAASYVSMELYLDLFSPVLADFNRDGKVDVAVPSRIASGVPSTHQLVRCFNYRPV